MEKNKFQVVSSVVAMVVIVGGGWLIGIAPQMAVVATANQSRVNVEIKNVANQVLLTKLKRDYQNIDDLKRQLESLRVTVPASAEISTFVTELNKLANLHQITVKSISVNDAKPYTPVAPGSASTSDKTPGVTAPNPRITAANFVVIPVQFSVTGDYAKVLNFVQDVQVGARLFFVATLSIIGSTTAKGVINSGVKTDITTRERVDSTIGGFVYVLLNSGKK